MACEGRGKPWDSEGSGSKEKSEEVDSSLSAEARPDREPLVEHGEREQVGRDNEMFVVLAPLPVPLLPLLCRDFI